MIEDNPADARLVEEYLAQDYPGRFSITVAGTLAQAAEEIQAQQYQVILTDLGLPDAQGLGTVRRLQEFDDSLPIVVLSGQEDEDLGTQIVQAGAQDYIIKGKGDGYLINRAIQYAIERKRIQLKLNHLAYYDSLTDLPNRSLFRERLDRALGRTVRNHSVGALMLIDLDGFKEVNDTYGHDVGDELLVAVAKTLQGGVREVDTVARLGGDEFTVLLEDLKDTNNAVLVADKFLHSLARPIHAGNRELSVTASIGITFFPTDSDNPVDLLKYADIAMYRAKAAGKNRRELFEPA